MGEAFNKPMIVMLKSELDLDSKSLRLDLNLNQR